MCIRLNVWRIVSLSDWKRWFSLDSALNAFTTRSPPRVSSIWAMSSPESCCPRRDFRLSDLPIRPISNPLIGSRMSTKMVSRQLIVKRTMR